MAKTAAVAVTTRIQTAPFFCIDLNMLPFISCLDRSNLVPLTQAGFDLGQSSKPPVIGADTPTTSISV